MFSVGRLPYQKYDEAFREMFFPIIEEDSYDENFRGE